MRQATRNYYTIRELTTIRDMRNTYALVQQLGHGIDLDTYMNYLVDMIAKGYRQIAVLENDQYIGIAGYWSGTKLFCGKYVELDNVVITASHRSKGIGHMLCSRLEEIARKNGARIAVLDAYVHNEKAHRFYFREGYTICGFHFLKSLENK